MNICGIDPGISGGIAVIDCSTTPPSCVAVDMPVIENERAGKTRRDVDPYKLGRFLREHRIDHVYIELVNAMPAQGEPDSSGKRRVQGTASAFAFGRSFGTLIGVVGALELPVTFVAPGKWKKGLGVPAAKHGALARATQLLPKAAHQWTRKKDDGRAEAALIALWGLREYGFVEIR